MDIDRWVPVPGERLRMELSGVAPSQFRVPAYRYDIDRVYIGVTIILAHLSHAIAAHVSRRALIRMAYDITRACARCECMRSRARAYTFPASYYICQCNRAYLIGCP